MNSTSETMSFIIIVLGSDALIPLIRYAKSADGKMQLTKKKRKKNCHVKYIQEL